jgi:hypothetical protein
MTTENLQQSTSPAPDLDYKKMYLDSENDAQIGAVARSCAEKVLERLASIKPNSSASVITDKMQEAILANDVPQILRLAETLKQIKEQEDSHIEKLVEISKEFRFDELMAAYPDEMEKLAYEVAILAMVTTQASIESQKKRSRTEGGKRARKVEVYIVTHDDRSIEVSPNKSRPALPGVDRAFYEFMGFTVSEDGRELTPNTFVDKSGAQVTSVTKKAILEDLQAGNPFWADKGYKVEAKAEAPATA